MIQTFLTLVAGHFVADFPLQSDAIATGKNRNLDPAKFGVPWFYWLISHAATHALMTGFILQNVYAGMIEFVCHFIIDFGKCEKIFGIHIDQILHIICKLVLVIIFSRKA